MYDIGASTSGVFGGDGPLPFAFVVKDLVGGLISFRVGHLGDAVATDVGEAGAPCFGIDDGGEVLGVGLATDVDERCGWGASADDDAVERGGGLRAAALDGVRHHT